MTATVTGARKKGAKRYEVILDVKGIDSVVIGGEYKLVRVETWEKPKKVTP